VPGGEGGDKDDLGGAKKIPRGAAALCRLLPAPMNLIEQYSNCNNWSLALNAKNKGTV